MRLLKAITKVKKVNDLKKQVEKESDKLAESINDLETALMVAYHSVDGVDDVFKWLTDKKKETLELRDNVNDKIAALINTMKEG